MAQVISFFARQAIMGNTGSATFYSEIFEVPQGAQFVAQFRVDASLDEAVSGTGILEHCMDQRLTPTNVWTQVGTSMSAVVGGSAYQAVSNLGRFLRAKITVPPGGAQVLSLDGVLRERT